MPLCDQAAVTVSSSFVIRKVFYLFCVRTGKISFAQSSGFLEFPFVVGSLMFTKRLQEVTALFKELAR